MCTGNGFLSKAIFPPIFLRPQITDQP
uniref:Uncharacterized protein n=1 Tax=Anguilla anguilla TaxID=7936 RepID=A0A0E9TTU8_ANGAN